MRNKEGEIVQIPTGHRYLALRQAELVLPIIRKEVKQALSKRKA